MAASDKVKAVLSLSGKRQQELANSFGMSKQTMSNKLARNSWSASDLARVAQFCNCELAFILPDGQKIIISVDDKETTSGDIPEA